MNIELRCKCGAAMVLTDLPCDRIMCQDIIREWRALHDGCIHKDVLLERVGSTGAYPLPKDWEIPCTITPLVSDPTHEVNHG